LFAFLISEFVSVSLATAMFMHTYRTRIEPLADGPASIEQNQSDKN